MQELNDIALFIELVKYKSFRATAEQLNMPVSTLSRRISYLEQQLGIRLLKRTTRRLELTEMGTVYYQRCKTSIEELRIAHEELGQQKNDITGIITLSLPSAFTLQYLSPLLLEFSGQYPNLSFNLDLTPRLVNLVSEPYDLAIRMGEPKDSQLVGHFLAKFSTALYASPTYLQQYGEPKEPKELIKHQCLIKNKNELWYLHKDKQEIIQQVTGKFIANDVTLLKQLACQHQGIILTTAHIVQQEIENKQLQRVLYGWQGKSVPVYALTENRLLPLKVRRLIDFLKEKLPLMNG